MAATLYNLIVKGCSISYDGTPSTGFKNKLAIIAGHFSTLGGFKSTPINTINSLRTVEGNRSIRPLTPKERDAVIKFQEEIDLSKDITQNFTKILTKNFIGKQVAMLSSLTLDSINANPMLCYALNLETPEDFLKFNTYQAIGRSVVTSMGYLVQDLLLYSSDNVYDGKHYEEGNKTKWDIVIEGLEGVKSFIEVKSGFNDMDVGQIKHYSDEIDLVEEEGNLGFFGVTYGKKDSKTVTAGLLETYVEDWRRKTLVGRELWDYVSQNEDYHKILIANIDEVAKKVLHNASVVKMIEKKIQDLLEDFNCKYSSLEDYYETLW